MRVEEALRPNIDVFLGEASGRYFGAGFRQVGHQLRDVRVDGAARSASARLDVRYPAEWSKKRNRELVPHLSSIDALTAAANLADVFLRDALGLGAEEIARCWVGDCLLKAAATPTTDLERVPVTLSLEQTEARSDALGGQRSRFACRVGAITVELLVDHPAGQRSEAAAERGEIEEALGPAERRHYGEAYKYMGVEITDVDARTRGRVDAELTLEPIRPWRAVGLSAAYEPFLSMVHVIVGGAQLAQVVLYEYDRITREGSNNLWMRRIAMHMPRPTPLVAPFRGQTWITKASIIPMKASQWRSANFELTFPGLKVEYSLAHELASRGV
ncbi:MAG TPA: AvrD family protein [Polyangiaceae bacterium]|jgi:hypothetical protein